MNELHLPGLAPLAAAWAARGWLALLALTVAVLFVAALRKPCRRWFGAGRAFQLWLLPPLALLASQLPHAAAASAPLAPLVYTITSAAGTVALQAGVASGFDWRIGAMLLWLAGGAAVVALAALAQRAFRRRLRGATPMADARSRRPVLRATRADVGPALVGAWRSRIVLPADFAERYDTIEQTLILAHEDAHARRGDGWWCLFSIACRAVLVPPAGVVGARGPAPRPGAGLRCRRAARARRATAQLCECDVENPVGRIRAAGGLRVVSSSSTHGAYCHVEITRTESPASIRRHRRNRLVDGGTGRFGLCRDRAHCVDAGCDRRGRGISTGHDCRLFQR